VEFLAEPYSPGFSSLKNPECFKEQVTRLCKKVKSLFGQEPKVFRNSCLIYSDEIGELVASMGFKGMLAEGANTYWDGRAHTSFTIATVIQT
jgi:alpha-amylase